MVIAVDVDNTLTLDTAWNATECLAAKPNRKVINHINKLYESNFIVIHTARRHNLYEATVQWLNANGVKYHAICMGKMPADMYIDDRAIGLDKIKIV